jgi:hypothetical protein
MRLNIYNNRDISDIPLIGNPQITYFKSVYRRHTNFIVERYRQKCEPGKIFNRINHIGQLIKSVDLEINISGNSTPVTDMPDNLGTTLIDEIILYIGSQKIERLTGEYIEMYMKLKNPRGLKTFNITSGPNLTCIEGTMEQILSLSGGVLNPNNLSPANIDIVLPIPFSFSREIGNALPMFLFHLNQPIYISFKTVENTLTATKFYNFIVNYIYLSENEQRRFELSNNEYIHEFIKEHPIQFTNGVEQELNSVGNVKSIMWKITPSNDLKYNIRINNGYKLFNQDKSYHYFTRKTISDAGFPGGGCSGSGTGSGTVCVVHDDTIAYYSFALKDYDKQEPLAPTGSISSSYNKIELTSNTDSPSIINVYTKSYNLISISNNKLKLEYQH